MEKTEFTCEGCSRVVKIDESVPAQRVFTATGAMDGVEHDYCADCDWLLIQEQPLPRGGGREDLMAECAADNARQLADEQRKFNRAGGVMVKIFRCEVCSRVVNVDESIAEDGVEHDYCAACNILSLTLRLLIQEQPLPLDNSGTEGVRHETEK